MVSGLKKGGKGGARNQGGDDRGKMKEERKEERKKQMGARGCGQTWKPSSRLLCHGPLIIRSITLCEMCFDV